MAEIQDKLENLDPENVAAVACVVTTKQPMNGGPEDLDASEAPDGFQWRVVNPKLEGYDGVNDVVATIASFNEALDQSEIQTERPQDLGSLLGLE